MSIVLPTSRNMLYNANMANHSYSSGVFSNPGDFGDGYRAMDRWSVSVTNGVGATARQIDLQASVNHPNNKSANNTLFRMETQAGASWGLVQRVEAKHVSDAVAAGAVSLQVPYLTDEFQEVRIRVGSATVFDDFTVTTESYNEVHSLTTDGQWQDGIIVENIPLDGNASNGIFVNYIFQNPLLGGGTRNLRLTQMMLNAGPQVQPFQLRHYDEGVGKLADKRYYQDLRFEINTEIGNYVNGPNQRTSQIISVFPMRTSPQVVKQFGYFQNVRASDPNTHWTVTIMDDEHSILRWSIEAAAAGWSFIGNPDIQLLAEL